MTHTKRTYTSLQKRFMLSFLFSISIPFLVFSETAPKHPASTAASTSSSISPSISKTISPPISSSIPKSTGVDSTPVKIGLIFKKDVTTARIQSLRGICKITFFAMPQVSGSEPLMSKEDTCKLQEEEDIALQVTHLGIMAQTSDGAEFQNSFSKIVIEAEDIFNLEIFNLAPYILSGKLEITLQDDRTLSFVNEISVGELVKASVSEFSPSPEPEANKAFLVMARSRAIAGKEMRRHASDSFDLCNTYHCLEFNGLGGIRDLIRILDRMVPNEVMIANGKVVFPHFQECCGGKISSMKNIYGIDDPVHQAIDDRIAGKGAENCFHSPSFRWTREFLQEEMADFLAVSYAGGSSHVFLRWDPIKTDPTERITEVRLVGKRKLKLSGTEFLQTSWEHFGVNALKSMCFTLEPMRRATIFRGKGRGLGVGLCLYGADGLAKKNFNYQDILKFYYSGIHLERDHQPVADAPQIQGSKSSGAK